MIEPHFTGDIREVSPNVLAYVGDSVFELYVRIHVINMSVTKPAALHKNSILFVKAKSQAKVARIIKPELSETELSVFRRGKNAYQASMAKNASPADYKYATGFEALIGYLYLTKQENRLNELLEKAIQIANWDEEVNLPSNGEDS